MKEHLIYLHKWHGRAGRESNDGQVIIQTYNPDNFCIKYAKEQNYDMFYETEIALRRQLKYPPFCDIIMIGISSASEQEVEKASKKIYELINKENIKYKTKIEVYRPVVAPISKIKNKYRWRIIIKCKLNNNIINLLNSVLEKYYNLKFKNTRVVVELPNVNIFPIPINFDGGVPNVPSFDFLGKYEENLLYYFKIYCLILFRSPNNFNLNSFSKSIFNSTLFSN